MMSGPRYPRFVQVLMLGMAAVTVSGLSSCDSTSKTLTRSPEAGSGETLPPPGPSQTKPNTALNPFSKPSQLPVPPSGSQPPSNPLALPSDGSAAPRDPLLPGGLPSIPQGTPQLPTGGAEQPTGGAELPANTQTSSVAQELAKARAELARKTQLPPQLTLPSNSRPEPAAPAPRPPVDAPSVDAPIRDTSGLTEEARALSQPVSRNAPAPAPSSPISTSLPSITSNSLPSMGFESSDATESGTNRSSGSSAGSRSARSTNPSGLRTAGFVYNPATGSYGPDN